MKKIRVGYEYTKTIIIDGTIEISEDEFINAKSIVEDHAEDKLCYGQEEIELVFDATCESCSNEILKSGQGYIRDNDVQLCDECIKEDC